MEFPSLTKNGISSARAAQIYKPQRVQAFLQGRTPGRDRRRGEPNSNKPYILSILSYMHVIYENLLYDTMW